MGQTCLEDAINQATGDTAPGNQRLARSALCPNAVALGIF